MLDTIRQEILDLCFSESALACKDNVEFNFLCIIDEANVAIKNLHGDNDASVLTDVILNIRELLDTLHE